MRTLTLAALAALALPLAGCVTAQQTARRSNPAFDDRCHRASQNALDGIKQLAEYGQQSTGVANFMFILNKDKTTARLDQSLSAAISLCIGSAAAAPPMLAVSYMGLVDAMTETRLKLPNLVKIKAVEAMAYSCNDHRRIKTFSTESGCSGATYY